MYAETIMLKGLQCSGPPKCCHTRQRPSLIIRTNRAYRPIFNIPPRGGLSSYIGIGSLMMLRVVIVREWPLFVYSFFDIKYFVKNWKENTYWNGSQGSYHSISV